MLQSWTITDLFKTNEFSCFYKAIGSSPSPRSKAEKSGWTRVDRARKRFPPSFSLVHFHAAPL